MLTRSDGEGGVGEGIKTKANDATSTLGVGMEQWKGMVKKQWWQRRCVNGRKLSSF